MHLPNAGTGPPTVRNEPGHETGLAEKGTSVASYRLIVIHRHPQRLSEGGPMLAG